jgi:outer membrane protein TolC
MAQSRQDLAAARLRLERLESDLKLNLERSASELRVAAGAAEVARLEVVAGEGKLKKCETLLEAGRVDPAELNNARMQLLEKRVAAIEAEKVLFECQVGLLETSGSLGALF